MLSRTYRTLYPHFIVALRLRIRIGQVVLFSVKGGSSPLIRIQNRVLNVLEDL
jgi:hypothetical protein